MDKSKKLRQSNLELLRIIAMFSILCFHCVFHSKAVIEPFGLNHYLVQSFLILGKFGVNLYVLISGYFMIKSRFRWEKVILLICEMYFYNIFIGIISYLWTSSPFSFAGMIKHTLHGISHPWFLTVYIMVYILSPFINKMILNLTQIQLKRLIIITTFIWSVIPTAVSLFNGGNSENLLYFNDFIIFIVIYIIGAYLRLYPSGVFNSKKSSALIAVLSYAFIFGFMFVYDRFSDILKPETAMYFIKQNSVFIVLLSIGVFCLFKDMNIKNSAVINTVASSVLGIYLLHDNKISKTFIWNDLLDMKTRLSGDFAVLYILGFCIAIFIVGFVIDIFRQFIEKYTLAKLLESSAYKKSKSYIADKYIKVISKL